MGAKNEIYAKGMDMKTVYLHGNGILSMISTKELYTKELKKGGIRDNEGL